MHKIIRVIAAGDLKLFYIFNDHLKCIFLDRIVPLITGLGGAFFTVTTSLILICFGKGIINMAGWQCLTALATSHIVVHYLKKIFARPRPFLNITNIHTFKNHLYDYSFPSGHTTAAFAMAFTLSIFFSPWTPLFITLAILVGLSRIYLGVHYPTDVFMGMIIGIVFSVANHILFNQWIFPVFNF
ncbi:phosphatase PAP2 family protein [Thermotalea metallivorans]|uniref:Putative undecaprenyl-diphosphatase YbjG n=1 Tax=Thermotalea metallivorans TaxID=520762 RepID=A0A140L7E5_9FIRM|nr:phosphatase PAP2 family protein [Thermotalea metallivorans]KXG76470.1 putative undecaprenyl-diphosphatase YbjG [Thermotalea metallivorans]